MDEIKIPLKIKPDFSTYWNVNKLMSYSDLKIFQIYGARGSGKTTGLMLHCLGRYIKKREQFVIVRRYGTELKLTGDILNNITDDNNIKVVGGKDILKYKYKGDVIGYSLAMTKATLYKSGIDFSRVTNIIFDEMTLIRGGSHRYLKNEVTIYYELISTITRTRKNYRVFILGNNLDLFNPYLSNYNVPRIVGNKWIDKARGLYIEFIPPNPKLLELEKETPLYKLTEGTQYWAYHYGNELYSNVKINVGIKSRNAILLYRLVYENVTLNVYLEIIKGKSRYFVEYRNKVIKDDISYIIIENNVYNYFMVSQFRDSNLSVDLYEAFYTERIVYSDEKAGNVLDKIIMLL